MRKHLVLGAAFLLAALAWTHLGQAQEEKEKPKGDPKKIVATLIKDLKSEDDGTRLQAVIQLAEFGEFAEGAVPGLIEALQTKDEDLRLNAAIALGKIGKPAVEPLGELLGSKDDDTRFYTIWALGWIGPEAKSTSGAVIRAMADKNDGVRRKAAYTLGRINPEPAAAIAALIEAFEDKQEDVRHAAAEGASKFGQAAVKSLTEVLKSEKSTVRQQAAHALGEIGSDAKDAVPALKEALLSAPKGDTPNLYADALGKIGKAAIPALNEALKSENAEVRGVAIHALAKVGSEAVPHLVDALGSKKIDVRRLVPQVLGPMRIGDKMVVLGLAFALKDEDEQVRLGCLNALQWLGPTGKLAAPHLQNALSDINFNIRQQAFHVLQNMGENPRDGLMKALDSKDEKIRINTASLMITMGIEPNTALPILVEGLKHKEVATKMQCAYALAITNREREKALPILVEGIKDKSVGVRQQAVQALQQMRDAAAAPALIEALQDSEPNIRQQAMWALQNVRGDPEIVVPALAKVLKEDKNVGIRQQVLNILPQYGAKGLPHVIEALKDKDANVRQQAVYSIQNFQDLKGMLPKLEPLLKDESAQVRQAMIQVLWRVGEPAVPHLLTALKDKDQNVRFIAANGLRNMGNNAAKAVPTLIDLVKEGDQNIRYQAVNTLANIADGADALIKMYPDVKDGALKANILQNVAYSPHRQKAIPLILDGLKDANAQVKISSMQMLGNAGIQSKEALGALKELVKDTNQQVRVNAVNAMSNMGQLAWPVLEDSLKSTKEVALRQAIVQSMANSGFRSKTAVPALIGLLKDSSPQIRWQACMVLGNNGADAKDALPALRELLNDTNQAVRNHAQNAINRIGAN